MYAAGRRSNSLQTTREEDDGGQCWNKRTRTRDKKSKRKKIKKSKKTKNGIKRVNEEIRLRGEPINDVDLTETSSKARNTAAAAAAADDDRRNNSVERVPTRNFFGTKQRNKHMKVKKSKKGNDDDDDDEDSYKISVEDVFARSAFGTKKRNKNVKRKDPSNETKSKRGNNNEEDDNYGNAVEDVLAKSSRGAEKKHKKTQRTKVRNETKSNEKADIKKGLQPVSLSEGDICSVESRPPSAERLRVVECPPRTIRLDIQLPAARPSESHVEVHGQERGGCELSGETSEGGRRSKKSVKVTNTESFGNLNVHVTIHCDVAAADDDDDDDNGAIGSEVRTPSEAAGPVNPVRGDATRTRHVTNPFVRDRQPNNHPETSCIDRWRKERLPAAGVQHADNDPSDPCHEACNTATTVQPLPELRCTETQNPDSFRETFETVTAEVAERGRTDRRHQQSPNSSLLDIRRLLREQQSMFDRYNAELDVMLNQCVDGLQLRSGPPTVQLEKLKNEKMMGEKVKMLAKTIENRNAVDREATTKVVRSQPVKVYKYLSPTLHREQRAVAAADDDDEGA